MVKKFWPILLCGADIRKILPVSFIVMLTLIQAGGKLVTFSLGMVVLLVAAPIFMATLRHFRGRGMSPGPMGASIFALFSAFEYGLPIWACLLLAIPALAILDFAPWILTYYILDYWWPRSKT
jgi:hypothetical protein